MSANVFLKKLRLRNFRSVRDTEITFDNPLFLVGRNGSGKSNVVDAIAFLADCVNLTLKAAMEKRLYLGHVVYNGLPSAMFIELQATADISNKANDGEGFYLLRLKIAEGDYTVESEECVVEKSGVRHFFKRDGDGFETSVSGLRPRLGSHNLALPLVGGIEEFAALADGFAAMRVYNIDHHKVRSNEGSEPSPVLASNGENIAGVLQRLSKLSNRLIIDEISSILRPIIPVETTFNPIQKNDGSFTIYGTEKRWDESFGGTVTTIQAPSIFSDGTMQAFGLIVALRQDPLPTVIVVEEPENNLHPGALNTIADLIEEASHKTQVIVTTHGPDLLDAKWIKPENLRVVEWENDASRVAELAEMPKSALRTHLMYAGQLMRANALDPAPEEKKEQASDESPVVAAQ